MSPRRLAPALAQLVADLDAIPTRDRVLRSARAVWRRIARLAANVPVHEQPCAAIEAWVESGWRDRARPRIEIGSLGELFDFIEKSSVLDRLDRAGRRRAGGR